LLGNWPSFTLNYGFCLQLLQAVEETHMRCARLAIGQSLDWLIPAQAEVLDTSA
jgi:hypothetical protein